MLDSVNGNVHVRGYFLICPASCGKHGYRKFGCGKIICYIFTGSWIMDAPLAIGEAVSNLYDTLEIFWHCGLITASSIPPSNP